MVKVIVVLMMMLLAVPVWATDFLVNKAGKDTNPCTPAAPCLTIGKAVALTKPGDRVLIGSGRYVDAVTTWNSGAKGLPISVIPVPGEKVEIGTAWLVTMKSYLRIQGLVFSNVRGGDALRFLGVVDATADKRNVKNLPTTTQFMVGIEVVDCVFSGGSGGPTPPGELVGPRQYAINMQGLGFNDTYVGPPVNAFRRNRIEDHSGTGIRLGEYTTDTLLENNVIQRLHQGAGGPQNNFNNTGEGVKMGGNSYRNVVRNNVCRDFYLDSKGGATTAYRLDVNSDSNLWEGNQAWNIGWPEVGQGRGFGIYSESRCDRNRFVRNLLVRIGTTGMRDGSDGTIKGVANVYDSNTVDQSRYCFASYNSEALTVTKNLCSNITSAFVDLQGQSVTWGKHVFASNNYWKGPAPLMFYVGPKAFNPKPNLSFVQWMLQMKETGATQQDPMFVNPANGDYHLKSMINPLTGRGAFP